MVLFHCLEIHGCLSFGNSCQAQKETKAAELLGVRNPGMPSLAFYAVLGLFVHVRTMAAAGLIVPLESCPAVASLWFTKLLDW